MDYGLAFLAGLIQGITEFLPVSSSGHLVVFHDLFGFNLPDDLFFDVMLHWGTLLALILVFHRDIAKMARGLFSSFFNWNFKNNFNQRLVWLVVLGAIPAVVLGYFFEDLIYNHLRSSFSVAVMLIVVAVLFWVAEKYSKKRKEIKEITVFNSLLIGLSQAIALVPGVSRSGITIISGLGLKLKREQAAKFSFLLAIPVVFGAGVKKIFEIGDWSNAQPLILLVGFLTAAVSGYIAVRFLLKYLSNHSLNAFAWYRLIIGCLILIFLFLR